MDRLACDRMFIAVVERHSLTAAAVKLGVSSGQASKLVSRLEEDLGVQLLHRTTRSVSTTEAGQAYYERIKGLLDDMDELDATIRSASTAPRGRLAMSVPITFGTQVLAPLLAEFAEAHPLIELDVSFSDRVVNLVEEGFDLALRIGTLRDSSLIARKLCPIRLVTTASPGYLAQFGNPATPADVAGHACIIDTNFADRATWRFAHGTSVPIRGRLRFSNAEACAAAAAIGLGLVQGPSFVAGNRIRAGQLVPVLDSFEPDPLALWAVYTTGRHLAAKVRVMVDFLIERFADNPPWDQGW
ncbi:LysR family transcriptional regulator [Devosia sp. SL43]|uniref:LysR family transcriptional regulator n=1 Tax=Devosia sp. SL43 TaxID=2806348 RepID=UPI001F22956C|nr:LysR family transcriptional regulator [Devosia sp. SL43]UJW84988.1 LysR family transcriptional regulator [Devosia sp. SL43]